MSTIFLQQNPNQQVAIGEQIVISKWTPSYFPFYKVNVDGAIFKDQNEVRVWVVIQDHVGNFIAGLSKKFQCPLKVIEVEAQAFESGLEFAKNMDIQDFVLEGDSLNIVHALCGNFHATSTITTLIFGVQVASYEFQNVLFSHVHRNGYMPAHQLAKHTLGIFDFSIWIEERVPIFLNRLFSMMYLLLLIINEVCVFSIKKKYIYYNQ